jgi:hypothetical protein
VLIAQLPWCWWESSLRLMLALLAFFPGGAYCKPSPLLQQEVLLPLPTAIILPVSQNPPFGGCDTRRIVLAFSFVRKARIERSLVGRRRESDER